MHGAVIWVGNLLINVKLSHARIHNCPTVDVAEGSLLTFRQLHAVTLAVTRSIDIALSCTPPLVCTATSHANTEVRHFSLDSCGALPACHHVCTSNNNMLQQGIIIFIAHKNKVQYGLLTVESHFGHKCWDTVGAQTHQL